MDHTDFVAAAKDRHPLTDLASFQPFIVDLVQSLPIEPDGTLPGLYVYEKESDGSDLMQVNGRWVSIKRIAYSDGQLFKVLSNAGPNGANGPEFELEGVDKARYLAVDRGPISSSGGNGQTPGPDVAALLKDLDLRVKDNQKQINDLIAQNGQLVTALESVNAHIDQKVNDGVTSVVKALEQNGGLGGLINLFGRR